MKKEFNATHYLERVLKKWNSFRSGHSRMKMAISSILLENEALKNLCNKQDKLITHYKLKFNKIYAFTEKYNKQDTATLLEVSYYGTILKDIEMKLDTDCVRIKTIYYKRNYYIQIWCNGHLLNQSSIRENKEWKDLM